jgi:RND family efflux transporter MFP subunit
MLRRTPALCLLPLTLFALGALSSPWLLAAETPPAPTLITIQAQPQTDWFEMDARIEPVDQGSVSAQTAGRVSQITVDVNDVVPAGQLLIEITNTSQSAGLDQAKAALQAAESQQRDTDRQLARMSALVAKGTISRRDYDTAKTQSDAAISAVDQAKAALVQAKENLGYTRILAPYAGIVSARHVALGETVNPGQLLLSGYAFAKMRLVADLPARFINLLQPETPLRATLPDGQILPLDQHELFQFSDPASHTYTLRALLPPQSQPRWHAGDWAKLALPLPQRAMIRIPESAVLRQSELSAVYLQQEQGFVLRQVRLGRHQEGQVEVLAGLKEGEQIAADAYAILNQQGGHYAP